MPANLASVNALQYAFWLVQKALGTKFDVTLLADPVSHPEDSKVMLTLERSGRGMEDEQAYNVLYTDMIEESADPIADALHELVHMMTYRLNELGEYRLRAPERDALHVAWENATYRLEEAILPLVRHWSLPWWKRIWKTHPRWAAPAVARPK